MRSRDVIMNVDPTFKKMIEDMRGEIEKSRGRRPSNGEITAEMAKKNFDRFMLEILGVRK